MSLTCYLIFLLLENIYVSNFANICSEMARVQTKARVDDLLLLSRQWLDGIKLVDVNMDAHTAVKYRTSTME